MSNRDRSTRSSASTTGSGEKPQKEQATCSGASAPACVSQVEFTPQVAARLRSRRFDGALTWMTPANPTRQPEGYWVGFESSPTTPHLHFVFHAWGERFWIEPVFYLPELWEQSDERIRAANAEAENARLVTAKTLVRKRRKSLLIPASELDHGISTERAHTLHKKMGRAGIEKGEDGRGHYRWAQKARPSTWPVPSSLTQLTPRQAAKLDYLIQQEIDRGRLGPRRYLESRDGNADVSAEVAHA